MTIFLLAVAYAFPQDLPSGSEIVSNFVKAKGGEVFLRKTATYRMQVELLVNGQKTADMEIFQAENRRLTFYTLPDGSMVSHGMDGKQAWYVDQTNTVHQLEGSELQRYLRQYSAVHESLEWPKQYIAMTCVGKEEIQGKAVWEVHFKPGHGQVVVRFFDVSSGLYVREVAPNDERATKTVIDISDYRRVAGGLVPHRRTVTEGSQTTEYIVRKSESNVRFPTERLPARGQNSLEKPLR